MQMHVWLVLQWLKRQSREIVIVLAIALLTTGCTALVMNYLLINSAQSTDVNLEITPQSQQQIKKM